MTNLRCRPGTTEHVAPRLTIMGIGRDTEHWRSWVLLRDVDGSARYWPLAEMLERADQIDGLDWLEAAIENGRGLCDADAEIWVRWKAALNREDCHV
jgi:hypothetical protein